MIIKPWMKWLIPIFFTLTICFYFPSFFIDNGTITIVGIILLTMFFHIVIKPFLAIITVNLLDNVIKKDLRWFNVNRCETLLFTILMVKKWKKFLPTYDKSAFDIKNTPIEKIIYSTKRAEVFHETTFLLSFLPLFLIIPYKLVWFFIITSVIGALMELIFVIEQRFNRPRLCKVALKKIKR